MTFRAHQHKRSQDQRHLEDLDVPLRERLVEGNEVENREQGNPAHAAQIERARRENETHQQKCVHRDQPCQISAPQIAECKEGEGDEVRDGSVVPDGNPGPERDRPVLREAAAVEVEPCLLRDEARLVEIVVRLLHGDDGVDLREARDRDRLDVDDDAARDVVRDDRQVGRGCDRLEMADDRTLRRLVVIRRHDQ